MADDVALTSYDPAGPKSFAVEAVAIHAALDPLHLFFVKGMPPYGTGRTHHVHVRSRARAEAVLSFRDRCSRQALSDAASPQWL